MSAISLSNIRKSYAGGPRILHDVSMEISPGEFIVIVGPSGCGKSTLLRLVAGLEGCEGGDIMIDGKRANDLAPRDRDIAMIFQNYALYPHMTVLQNIAFGLELRGVPKSERTARAQEVARMLQLDAYLDRKPGALSGGQRQRVAMGRAMARNTSTFLMDEPLSNLDNALRVTMRAEIKEMHQKLGATIIYVTHDQTEALSLADRIAVMKDGHLQQFDTPEAIYDRPANRFVASFLGAPSMNFLDADRLPGFNAPAALTAGLRPDALSVHERQPGEAALPGRVLLSEMTGSELILHCETPAGRVTLTSHRKSLPRDPSDLWIGFDVSQAHFFDTQSGDRVELGR
ncbi:MULTISPECIES: ABC transporter ATP-binding protein [Nitratireductor]|uniref:ABC transporter ATP-binding protein n=1 Tax=Nitratireductor TaxID=245876 RepID=UPI0019D3310B|nr:MULTISPECIES: ATP-binding cassette domain-containing protein [Nitratireductor]MBN7776467.1 ATP-binding cassette domain-containing protein [Nitratireductor pacificus]MBN7779334.1 ATP-binding cassette domain-containing protein [Nitratireductor pacificus]MBN7788141.1 ATP-binding cassette domain-containing protein [Nitratireductor aquimarinus]MBY6098188.1 ATP-binding cassette domain-containing protein [Nitratireductor aquimarinus]MCA1259166.1 ATP-binding cassette domain-containing protein [Nitr